MQQQTQLFDMSTDELSPPLHHLVTTTLSVVLLALKVYDAYLSRREKQLLQQTEELDAIPEDWLQRAHEGLETAPTCPTHCALCHERLFDEHGNADRPIVDTNCQHLVHVACLRQYGANHPIGHDGDNNNSSSNCEACPICQIPLAANPLPVHDDDDDVHDDIFQDVHVDQHYHHHHHHHGEIDEEEAQHDTEAAIRHLHDEYHDDHHEHRSFRQAADFPVFWWKRIEHCLESIGPSNGPIHIDLIKDLLRQDKTLTERQLRYIDDDDDDDDAVGDTNDEEEDEEDSDDEDDDDDAIQWIINSMYNTDSSPTVHWLDAETDGIPSHSSIVHSRAPLVRRRDRRDAPAARFRHALRHGDRVDLTKPIKGGPEAGGFLWAGTEERMWIFDERNETLWLRSWPLWSMFR